MKAPAYPGIAFYRNTIQAQPLLGKEIGSSYSRVLAGWFGEGAGSNPAQLISSPLFHFLTQECHLGFLPQQTDRGEVCFAQNGEIRPQFRQCFTMLQFLDYGYACLHLYKSVVEAHSTLPVPSNELIFWELSGLGESLRLVHLGRGNIPYAESPSFVTNVEGQVGEPVFVPVNAMDPLLLKKEGPEAVYEEQVVGKVYVNDTQYFFPIRQSVWMASMYGINPARQYLESLKGTTLTMEHVERFGKILHAVGETLQLTGKIKKIVKNT